jgi:F5/8 type C domain
MRRGFVAAGLYGGLTVALLFPLLGHFGSAFPHDPGDPILNTWILWHGARTLPLTHAWWNGPMFFPMADSIALSEVLLSSLPISWVVQALTHNPVAAYNVVFALSFPLCGLGAYFLARELTGREDAALVGGLAFMLAPYRAEQLSHLPVLSYYWAPIVLFALHRYARQRHWKWLALFGTAWLAQSLANGYAMFHLSILVALWIVWFMRPLRICVPVLVAWAVAALPMLPILLRYEEVHSALHLLRDINEVKRFGVDLGDFLAAPPDLALWGGRLGVARPETAAFAGVTLLVLGLAAIVVTRLERREQEPRALWQRMFVMISAAAALVAFSAYFLGPWAIGPLTVRDFHKPFSIAVAARALAFLGGSWMRRMWRERSIAGFYLVATAAMLLLALGPEPRLLGRPILYEPPYAWLMHLPGFSVLRVPARFVMPAALCESVLVALAIARWAVLSRRVAVVALVSLGIALDGWFRLPVAAAPVGGIHAWPEHIAAVVELPLGEPAADFAAIYRAMTHGRPIVNGVSGYVPPHFLPLAQALRARQFSALYELTARGPIAVALDRTQADAAGILALLRGAGFTPGPSEGNWDSMIVPVRRLQPVALGARLPIAAAHASVHGGDAGRMLDDDPVTAWGTEVGQAGGEEVVVDLGSDRAIGAIVLDMGAYSFGYPRALEIDVSRDRADWLSVWGGEPAVLAVRGAVQDPGTAPIILDLGRTTGRYVRLTQTGAEPGIPWWIAGIHIHAPVVVDAR